MVEDKQGHVKEINYESNNEGSTTIGDKGKHVSFKEDTNTDLLEENSEISVGGSKSAKKRRCRQERDKKQKNVLEQQIQMAAD